MLIGFGYAIIWCTPEINLLAGEAAQRNIVPLGVLWLFKFGCYAMQFWQPEVSQVGTISKTDQVKVNNCAHLGAPIQFCNILLKNSHINSSLFFERLL